MKKRLIWTAAILVAWTWALSAFGAQVLFSFQNAAAAGQTNRPMFLYPTGGPFTNGAGVIITRDRVQGTTDGSGNLTISNVYGWTYRGELQGSFGNTTNYYNFPVTNGLIAAASYAGSPTNANGIIAYSQAQSDARYLAANSPVILNAVTNNGAGTNVALWAGNAIALSVSNTPITVIVPSTATTNLTTAGVLIQSPAGTTNSYPFILVVKTNQSFAIQDEAGNNLFGIRHDAYPTSAARHWEVNFGSKEQPLVDQLFDMGAGADIGWRINGDLNQSLFMATSTLGIEYRYANSNYFQLGLGTGSALFDSYGRLHTQSFYGDFVQQNQTVIPGAGAGTGGSVGATFDDEASDVSVQIILVTGHSGLGAGTLFTYTLENAARIADANMVNVPVKPVFSAAGANAAGVAAAVYCTATGTGFTFKSTAALTADTTYAWNFILCR